MDLAENMALFNANEDLIVSDIKVKVTMEVKFSFSKVSICDIEVEVKSMKTKKASTFMNIPTKQLKQVTGYYWGTFNGNLEK